MEHILLLWINCLCYYTFCAVQNNLVVLVIIYQLISPLFHILNGGWAEINWNFDAFFKPMFVCVSSLELYLINILLIKNSFRFKTKDSFSPLLRIHLEENVKIWITNPGEKSPPILIPPTHNIIGTTHLPPSLSSTIQYINH